MSTIRFYSAAVVAAVVLLGIVGYAQGAYGTGTESFDSIRIGQAGVGGVTFFNGTIVNETTNAAGIDNPVVFGDSMRIDGRIWRGEFQGPGDSLPVIIDDDVQITGSLKLGNVTNVADTLTSSVQLSVLIADEIVNLQGFIECVGTGLGSSEPVIGYDWNFCSNLWSVALANLEDDALVTAGTDPLQLRLHERADEIAQKRAIMQTR